MEPNKPQDSESSSSSDDATEQGSNSGAEPDQSNPYQSPEYSTSRHEQAEPSYEERQYAMFCHFAAFAGLIIPFGSIIGPLVLWLIKKDESEYINYHGKEALNFNITMAFVSIFCIALMLVLIGFLLLFIVAIIWLILIIIAGINANDGVYYRYPFCFRIIY